MPAQATKKQKLAAPRGDQVGAASGTSTTSSYGFDGDQRHGAAPNHDAEQPAAASASGSAHSLALTLATLPIPAVHETLQYTLEYGFSPQIELSRCYTCHFPAHAQIIYEQPPGGSDAGRSMLRRFLQSFFAEAQDVRGIAAITLAGHYPKGSSDLRDIVQELLTMERVRADDRAGMDGLMTFIADRRPGGGGGGGGGGGRPYSSCPENAGGVVAIAVCLVLGFELTYELAECAVNAYIRSARAREQLHRHCNFSFVGLPGNCCEPPRLDPRLASSAAG